MNTIIEKVGKLLADRLTGFKFVKSKLQLIRDTDVGWLAIIIDILPTSTDGIVKLAAHAHVRIDEIENYYAVHNPFLSPKDIKSHPTLVKNCDEIIVNKDLPNGFTDDEQSVGLFIDKYVDALDSDVIPWLEYYSNEGNLLSGLISKDPQTRVTSDKLTIFPVGLTIYAKLGKWKEFDQFAKEFMTHCEKPYALVYKPLAHNTIQGLEDQLR